MTLKETPVKGKEQDIKEWKKCGQMQRSIKIFNTDFYKIQ